jgi:phage baseplate assembly protein W
MSSITASSRFYKVYYTDLNCRYTLDDKQLVITNANAVNNELLNLILTSPGELAFEPDFGCNIPNLLFEQPTQVVNWMISNNLFIAVARWIPYVDIDASLSSITGLPNDMGYYFKLYYSVAGLMAGGADFRFQT